MALAPPTPARRKRKHPPLSHPSCPVNSQKARGAITVVTWRTNPRERGQCKEVLKGRGGRVPLPILLTGRPQARSHRVKIVDPAAWIRWTTKRAIKTRNGNLKPTTKPAQGMQYTLLARAKKSTPVPVFGIVPPYYHYLHIPGTTSCTSPDEPPACSPITPLLARYSPSGGTETRARPRTADTTQHTKRQQTKPRRSSRLGALPALWLSPRNSVVQKQNKWRLPPACFQQYAPTKKGLSPAKRPINLCIRFLFSEPNNNSNQSRPVPSASFGDSPTCH